MRRQSDSTQRNELTLSEAARPNYTKRGGKLRQKRETIQLNTRKGRLTKKSQAIAQKIGQPTDQEKETRHTTDGNVQGEGYSRRRLHYVSNRRVKES